MSHRTEAQPTDNLLAAARPLAELPFFQLDVEIWPSKQSVQRGFTGHPSAAAFGGLLERTNEFQVSAGGKSAWMGKLSGERVAPAVSAGPDTGAPRPYLAGVGCKQS